MEQRKNCVKNLFHKMEKTLVFLVHEGNYHCRTRNVCGSRATARFETKQRSKICDLDLQSMAVISTWIYSSGDLYTLHTLGNEIKGFKSYSLGTLKLQVIRCV